MTSIREQQQQAYDRLISSPAEFRKVLKIEVGGELKSLESCLDPWQRADFENLLDPACIRVVYPAAKLAVEPRLRVYIERGRGHSKTADLALVLAWMLFASRRKITGISAAKDMEQAKRIRDAIDTLVRHNPWLGSHIKINNWKVSNESTGSELEIIASDAAGAYGLLCDFVAIDEITHWSERGQDLWTSLLSTAAKRPRCLLISIANAGFMDGWQWSLREAIRNDPDWHFSRLDGPRASWITGKQLGEQRRLLPMIAYNRLWLNVWTEGAGDALADADIRAATTLGGPTSESENGWAYFAGLDLGISRDASALAIVGKNVGYTQQIYRPAPRYLSRVQRAIAEIDGLPVEYDSKFFPGTGRLKLVDLRIWRPGKGVRVSLEEVEKEILALHARYGMFVAADPWQAAQMLERLQARQVACDGFAFTGSNLDEMCSATLSAFNDRTLEIYPDNALLADLRRLRVEEKRYGVRLTSPRARAGDADSTAHGDTCTALALALTAAKRFGNVPAGPQSIQGPLLVWP